MTYEDTIFLHKGGPIWDADIPDDQRNPNIPNELPGWFFWCEDECSYHGPFATREECERSFDKYCLELEETPLSPEEEHERKFRAALKGSVTWKTS